MVFLLAMGLWARSYFAWERMVMTTYPTSVDASSGFSGFADHSLTWSRGSVSFSRFHVEMKNGNYAGRVQWNYLRENPRPMRMPERNGDLTNIQVLGFGLLHTQTVGGRYRDDIIEVRAPLWSFAVFGVPPALWLRRRLRQRARGFAVQTVDAAER